MLHFLLQRLRKWFKRAKDIPESDISEDANDTELAEPVVHILVTVREDGDFEVSTDISNLNTPIVDVTAMIFHLINSGLMAEYFIQSLNLWAEDDEQKAFAREVISNWKDFYDEANTTENSLTNSKLAVDPSDVFGLKSLKGM
tara:strand:+ start:570 stop:998 length:429 start_codon:yes stop_codon:yes gene_type:complete